MPTTLLLTPADSARAIGEVYGVSLLATVPLLVALVAVVLLQRSGAGTRVLVWRSAVAAMLVVYAGRFLPFHWMAWVVPDGLASPLVALGRAQLEVLESFPRVAGNDGALGGAVVRGILVLYWTGAALVLLPVIAARWRLSRLAAGASPLIGPRWRELLAESCAALGVGAPVRLLLSPAVVVPITWGTRHPGIVLPPAAMRWNPEQRRAAVLHELAHAKGADALMAVLARVVCALFWFHPGAWWVARHLSAEAEFACDDRVLLSGVRRSDYAELLASVLGGERAVPLAAIALVRRTGLRARLALILDVTRVPRAPSRVATVGVALFTILVALPTGTVRLAPTRDVLTMLMRDARWESRAFAVVRLAPRRDSVQVARDAARHDPNPRVRAWARYALAQRADPAVAPRATTH